MRAFEIIFAAAEQVHQAEQRFWTPLARAWPGEPAPSMHGTTPRSLIHLLEQDQPARNPPSAVVMALANSERIEVIDRCVEALHQRGVPALILAESPQRWAPLTSPGILLQGWDHRPEVAAAMLYALASRQAHVEALTRELALAMRCHAGVRGEIARIHEELHLAAGIQNEFTGAPLPRTEGLEMGVLFRPVNQVSGDIYNVRELGDGKVAFFLADAMGHGVPAALLTMVLTNTLLSPEHEQARREPAELLARLNKRLVEASLNTGRFATAIYGVVDAASGLVRLSNAGHPPASVFSAGGVRTMQAGGPLLGIFADAAFDTTEFTLGPGQTLLIYSDGLETAFPRAGGGQGRREHLRLTARSLEDCQERPLAEAITRLEHLVDEQTGSLHQFDDVTVLAVRLSNQAGAARKAA